MKNQTSHIKYLLVAPALLALFTLNLQLTTAFAQGSLTPPGAPAPTMLTLSQVEPRTPISTLPYAITHPGSYYLTANLTGVSGQDGITISANDVTLDLMGFTLLGVSGSGNGINVVSGWGNNLAIRNGVLDSWGADGVNAGNASNGQFERLRISNSGGQTGLFAGDSCFVLACTANRNNGDGIEADGDNCTVKDCTANVNVNNGISLYGSASRIDGNVLTSNGVYGILYESEHADSVITRNSAPSNGLGGYNAVGDPSFGPIQTLSTATSPWANF